MPDRETEAAETAREEQKRNEAREEKRIDEILDKLSKANRSAFEIGHVPSGPLSPLDVPRRH